MQPTITVIRAIGAEFARRIVQPLILIGAVVAILLLILGGWLTTQSPWWWLLEAVFIVGTLIFAALAVVVMVIVRTVAPTLTKTQKQSVRSFVDKLARVAEHLQTPQLLLIFNVVRDTVRPQQHGFIETVSMDSKTLAPEFIKLRREFE